MELKVADPTGFCFGVRRAIDQLEDALRRYGAVYSLGSPIHNPQEIDRLRALGLIVADSPDEVPSGKTAFIRAHGISSAEALRLAERTDIIVDGTCPLVRTAKERAVSLSEEGYKVVVLGDDQHPEVRGIVGCLEGEYLVVSSPDDLPKAFDTKIGVLSQTTQKESTLAALVSNLVLLAKEIKVYNTICLATIERQDSVRKLAAEVDGMIVIGGRNSANTKKLVDISKTCGVETIWIEHPDEIERSWSIGKAKIGVAAGASTPDWLINDLTSKLQKL